MTTLCPSQVDIGSQAARRLRSRHRRMHLALFVVVLLSLSDLYLTVLYVTQGSFAEGNPLARAIMHSQSIGLLVAWKVGSVLTTVGILYKIRRSRSAELGAWVCCGVLSWLTYQWIGYIDAPMVEARELAEYGYGSEEWVTLVPMD